MSPKLSRESRERTSGQRGEHKQHHRMATISKSGPNGSKRKSWPRCRQADKTKTTLNGGGGQVEGGGGGGGADGLGTLGASAAVVHRDITIN